MALAVGTTLNLSGKKILLHTVVFIKYHSTQSIDQRHFHGEEYVHILQLIT